MSELDLIIKEQRSLLKLLIKLEIRFEQQEKSERTSGFLNSLIQQLDKLFGKFELKHEHIVRRIHEESIEDADV